MELVYVGFGTENALKNSKKKYKITDVEAGLHPSYYPPLISGLYGLDVAVTTNSALLLDFVEAKDVIVCNHDKVSLLCLHPDFNKWKDEFAPGEMWSIWGEGWVW